MIVLKKEDKEFKLVPRTRKVIELTEKLKTNNLNDLIFKGFNECNIKVLAELIKTFAEYEDGKTVFSSVNVVFDFIDEWRSENEKSYTDLYKEVIGVVNDMGFFKEKMTQEQLSQMMENPALTIDIQKVVTESAQKAIQEIAEEEFRGYQG